MKPISADSHVVEGRDVFTGLAERFGDEAPRIMDVGDQVDAIVTPARGMRGVSVARMGMAATRLARDVSRKVEETLQYPGQIRVTVVRETRASAVAR